MSTPKIPHVFAHKLVLAFISVCVAQAFCSVDVTVLGQALLELQSGCLTFVNSQKTIRRQYTRRS